MLQSKLVFKTKKTSPKDDLSKNARLLQQAGFIYKDMAGAYSFLPLGLMVLNNIIAIIREEMNKIGSREILMTALQPRERWEKTGRWSDDIIDVWFKTELAHGGLLGLGNTHEEAIAEIMSEHISSYKDLPCATYQFQTKFRNEPRAKSGIMRTREFIMKDLYSFSKDQAELDEFYETAKQAYFNIFNRVGLGDKTYLTFASGGAFSKWSHEFQTVCDAGEDLIYIDTDKNIAINKEVLSDNVCAELNISKDKLKEAKAVEVGNIFKLGTRFSEPAGLFYTDISGKRQPVVMGCYGIGPGRVMGTIVELLSDDKGIIWPESISPFKVHLLDLGNSELALKVYKELSSQNIDTLLDDRDVSPGAKFADADLIGIPYRLVISSKTEDKIELKSRSSDAIETLSLSDIINKLLAVSELP